MIKKRKAETPNESYDKLIIDAKPFTFKRKDGISVWVRPRGEIILDRSDPIKYQRWLVATRLLLDHYLEQERTRRRTEEEKKEGTG